MDLAAMEACPEKDVDKIPGSFFVNISFEYHKKKVLRLVVRSAYRPSYRPHISELSINVCGHSVSKRGIRNNVYVYNTFFYDNISHRSKGFHSEKKWTKKVR